MKLELKSKGLAYSDLSTSLKMTHRKPNSLVIFLASLLVMMSPNFLLAEEEKEVVPLMYFDIDPKILTFYQSSGKKIGYVVVQVNIAVKGQENLDLVELHTPLIQDNLIDFFNRQDKTTIQSFSEREGLRQKAQESVAAVLEAEIGKNVIESLLFTDYVYQ
ncbi:MAG: flagellar basal body-associated FliL family protein [Kangiellaceae bacterium]